MPDSPTGSSAVTVPLGHESAGEHSAVAGRRAARRRSGFWRELAGSLAVGMAVLALVVVAFQVLALVRGIPGPGLLVVGGHLLAAVLVTVGRRIADRTSGWRAAVPVSVVAAVTTTTLWLFWWA